MSVRNIYNQNGTISSKVHIENWLEERAMFQQTGVNRAKSATGKDDNTAVRTVKTSTEIQPKEWRSLTQTDFVVQAETEKKAELERHQTPSRNAIREAKIIERAKQLLSEEQVRQEEQKQQEANEASFGHYKPLNRSKILKSDDIKHSLSENAITYKTASGSTSFNKSTTFSKPIGDLLVDEKQIWRKV
eukprot:TRINITY_DN5899_c0_g1_i1.p1 TRINITY_DN5899_c0_g1~~TRINITY_DN5899_c0_g1_i1.p1  ORF type:complete len:189 (-),score=43.81 TRINITY_DN5899_c0_g1_i1:49-615(-)